MPVDDAHGREERPSDAAADTFGGTLRAAREARGLSVEDVCATTRIRATLVRDLEAGRVASSGGAVYARGHVRSLAQAVGADAGPVLARFDREVRTDSDLVDATAAPVTLAAPAAGAGSLGDRVLGIGGLGTAFQTRPERHGPRWALGGTVALVALVGIVALGNRGATVPHATVDSLGLGAGGGASPTPAPEPTASPLAPAAVAQLPASTDAQLRIRTVGGPSWIRVRTATTTLFEGVLPDGTTKDFKDPKELSVVVGNAGAVSLVCSGKDLGPVGGPGQISRFTCSAAGLVPA